MRLFLWNINGRSGTTKNYQIPTRLIIEQIIVNKSPEIIILTELVKYAPGYCELKTALEDFGYNVFCSDFKISNNKSENQVLIAIKKDCCEVVIEDECKFGICGETEFVENKKLKNKDTKDTFEKMYNLDKLIVENIMNYPNYLKIKFIHKDSGKKVSVVGCRMLTGGYTQLSKQYDDYIKQFRKQYDDEAIQFYGCLLPEIYKVKQESDIVIVAGDFNNARYYGEKNSEYSEENMKQHSYSEEIIKKFYNGKAQCNYNLHRIYEAFSNKIFMKFIMLDNWQATHKIFSDDHIFVFGCEKSSCKLPTCEPPIWNFIKKPYYEYESFEKWTEKNYPDIEGLPDHAILIADIDIGDE